ncbi:unnamed protein product (macronuclear) [Paramecium tetraurelia]|uniref:Transmembrane protein n=1 Tax=Paramecium tetraurelia TaxID=5888 RepID=A0BQW2_PARTE|nr:uncharacterized protein GSPATT00031158001 [Paramecium tetraurelia]CAK60929.1 unnamed protein product [Paramecium tetraurelia]|eukprot:XP_001428327.1 hypothetical protein (macronuclear) [Paramecium tetraurelia strain d4-2]
MNQAKLRQFQNFQFENNVVWKDFIKELDPTIPKERFEKLKKIWYRDNIDPEFDPEFIGNTNSYTTHENHTHSQQRRGFDLGEQTLVVKILLGVENFLKLAFIITSFIPIGPNTLFAAVACVLGLYRLCKFPQMTKEYGRLVLQNEFAQNLLFLFGHFFVYSFKTVFNVPLILHFALGLSSYILLLQGPIYELFKTKVDKIYQMKDQIYVLKYRIEIALVPASFVFLFLGKSSILTFVYFANFARIKYILVDKFKVECKYVNQKYLEPYKTNPILSYIIPAFQQLCSYLIPTW